MALDRALDNAATTLLWLRQLASARLDQFRLSKRHRQRRGLYQLAIDIRRELRIIGVHRLCDTHRTTRHQGDAGGGCR
ncbi:MAG: hypothetical protein AAF250_04695 [Pseudomonadota bacterium]